MLLSDLDELPSGRLAGYEFVFEPTLCPIATRVAKEELHETPEKQQRCIEELRKLLEQEENLVVPIDNSDWLIRFLRARNYNVPDTFTLVKQKVHKFYLTIK